MLTDLERDANVKGLGTYKEYYELLNEYLEYLHKLLLAFKIKKLSMLNKEKEFFQYTSGDLVYISFLKNKIRTLAEKYW